MGLYWGNIGVILWLHWGPLFMQTTKSSSDKCKAVQAYANTVGQQSSNLPGIRYNSSPQSPPLLFGWSSGKLLNSMLILAVTLATMKHQATSGQPVLG